MRNRKDVVEAGVLERREERGNENDNWKGFQCKDEKRSYEKRDGGEGKEGKEAVEGCKDK